jgi:hypothetical protein
MFVILKPFEERHGAEFYSDAIAGKLRQAFHENIDEAQISVFGAPPVDGLGNAGGFKLMVQDRADVGLDTLQEQTDNLVVKGNQQPGLVCRIVHCRRFHLSRRQLVSKGTCGEKASPGTGLLRVAEKNQAAPLARLGP